MGVKLLAGVVTLATIGLLILACNGGPTNPDDGSRNPIEGSGNVVVQTFTIADFDRVEASHTFVVDISHANSFSVKVSADDNILDRLDVRKRGNTLVLGLANGSFENITLRAEVTMPNLQGVKADGASHVTLDGFRSDDPTNLEVSGASLISGDIEAGEMKVEVSGASMLVTSVTSLSKRRPETLVGLAPQFWMFRTPLGRSL